MDDETYRVILAALDRYAEDLGSEPTDSDPERADEIEAELQRIEVAEWFVRSLGYRENATPAR